MTNSDFKPDYPLIDCRPFNLYQHGHVSGATHIAASELFERMHELPQKTQSVSLCGTEDDLLEARQFLTEKGYHIHQEVLWTDTLATQLKQQNLWETGADSQRLWQPAHLIKHFVENALANTAGTGLDLACGSGRDMVYLAQHGWQMTGIDYLPGALQRAQQLAKHNHVTINTLQLDLETGNNPFPDNMLQQFDLICVFRYLHRPLFPYLKGLLKPGGFIIYQTFMQGCEVISRPRNPNFLLAPDELANTFAGYHIKQNTIEYLNDGRPTSAFIAQKPK